MKVLKFSEDYLLKHGWVWDLGKLGDFQHDDRIYYFEEGGWFIVRGAYSYKGWVFNNVEITAIVDADGLDYEPEYAEDIADLRWVDFMIYPTGETSIIEKGEVEDLRDTFFIELIEKGGDV